MTTWYSPDEITNEADGAKRQPEFDPAVVEEDPIVEGALAVDGVAELIASQTEVRAIIAAEIDNDEEPTVDA